MAIGQWIQAGLDGSLKKNTIPILDFFMCVEKPGMKFGERLNHQKGNSAPPAARPSTSVSEIPVV
jgi:hypothetical protein